MEERNLPLSTGFNTTSAGACIAVPSALMFVFGFYNGGYADCYANDLSKLIHRGVIYAHKVKHGIWHFTRRQGMKDQAQINVHHKTTTKHTSKRNPHVVSPYIFCNYFSQSILPSLSYWSHFTL